MATFPAVLDACVLYNAAVRDTLLWTAHFGFFRVHWSEKILDEALANLVADGRVTSEIAGRLRAVFQKQFPFALVAEAPQALIDAMPVEPKDRHVAATAVVGEARVIVTFNLADFPASELEPFGIDVQSPDAFLCHQYWLHPEAMAEVIRRQAGNLRRPPMPVEAVLGSLERFVPDFVALLRPHLA
jgi:hypothetical protein